jgi:ADP-heptose:LPS heptosyltransferase
MMEIGHHLASEEQLPNAPVGHARREDGGRAHRRRRPMTSRTLVARLDSAGDVLLQGPAVRAVAASSRHVAMLCGPRGEDAAHLLPGVDEVLTYAAGWIDPEPPAVTWGDAMALVARLAELDVDVAVILTSFQQSPLPLALLLRMADVGRIGAISPEYPGSLLDVRQPVDDDVHEVERSLSLVAAMGFRLPPGDDGRLLVERHGHLPPGVLPLAPYIAVHPGAPAPARAWSPEKHAALVRLLVANGQRVVVTGSAGEADLCAHVAGEPRPDVLDLGGRTDLAGLTEVLAGARALVCGSTGPAQLAAAVGTPVVSLFAPVVPAVRRRPWMVPHRLLGRQDAPCAGSRARVCPAPGHPCLEEVEPAHVVDALESVASDGRW